LFEKIKAWGQTEQVFHLAKSLRMHTQQFVYPYFYYVQFLLGNSKNYGSQIIAYAYAMIP